MQVTGVGHLFCYHWSEREIRDWAGVNAARADITGALGMAMLNRGYYARGRGIVSAAHKPSHVRGLVKAMEQCLLELDLTVAEPHRHFRLNAAAAQPPEPPQHFRPAVAGS